MKHLRFLYAAAVLIGLSSPAAAQMDDSSSRWRSSQVSVTTSATLVAPITPSRRQVMVTTLGTAQVYCGPDNTVTSSTGTPIANVAFSSISLPTTAAVWCIAASAQTVAIAESF